MNKDIIYDKVGQEVNIGDTILYCKFSELNPAKVVKITPKALVISCLRQSFKIDPGQDNIPRWQRKGKWINDVKGKIVHNQEDTSKHNSTKRLNRFTWNGSPWIKNTIIKIR
jgi:hypothetical protein